MSTRLQFLRFEWRSPAMTRLDIRLHVPVPATHLQPGHASRSLLEFPPRCSSSAVRRTAAAMPPAPPASAAPRVRARLAPADSLRSLLAGRRLSSTSLRPLSTRPTPPARGCTPTISGLYVCVHEKIGGRCSSSCWIWFTLEWCRYTR